MSISHFNVRAQRMMLDTPAHIALDFVSGESWWAPPAVEGPEIVQQLYGRQLAVDFATWVKDNWEPEALAKIVACMPRDMGEVEKTFLLTIAEWMPTGSMV